ncbi:MAG: TrkH family potassium uptake protein [Chlamydiales bacterium]|nr:TrkH family potassium uptake protein [Chlamydiales bacterium]
MHLFRQKLNWAAIVGQLGLLLHVPAAMAFLTLLVALFFGEWFALIPFTVVGFGTLILGQVAYQLNKKAKPAHVWDAMIIAGLSWLLCSFFAAIPFYWIAHFQLQSGIESEILSVFTSPTNSFFEAMSGFTSTGLTMVQYEGPFPYVLQWWRSFLEWIGGLGLVVFILALTHLNKQGFQLYYAEARSERMAKNMTSTAHWIWGIYLSFTLIGMVLFLLLGMPFWEAMNHAMTAISNGGFALSTSNFQNYSMGIQLVAMLIMIIGAISFLIHFRVIREKEFSILWKNLQQRLLYVFLVAGGGLVILLNLWNHQNPNWIHSYFEWTSALTTCGFSSTDLSIFSPMVKLLLIIAMFVGGSTGSTAGGLKIKRLIYLMNGVTLRLLSLTTQKEKTITKNTKDEPPGVDLPASKKSKRLVTAEVLFSLWTATAFLGWFLILEWVPKGRAIDALFDVTSAMSNVGLTSGIITPESPLFGKWVFIFLMWIGRLEIIPVLVLLLSFPLFFKRKKSHGKKS